MPVDPLSRFTPEQDALIRRMVADGHKSRAVWNALNEQGGPQHYIVWVQKKMARIRNAKKMKSRQIENFGPPKIARENAPKPKRPIPATETFLRERAIGWGIWDGTLDLETLNAIARAKNLPEWVLA